MTVPAHSPNQESQSLREQVRRAVIWRSGTQVVGQLVTWVSTFLVIRILTPTDYGIYAMTAVIVLFLSLVNGHGFAAAIIQRKEVDKHTLRQLLGILIVVNAGLAGLQLLAAPFAALYYDEPMVADVLRAQALLYITTPFAMVAYAILARQMEFKRQAQVNIVAAIVGAATALGGALAGWGVWTLVWPPLVSATISALGLTIFARSLMWPSFSFAGTSSIFRFGGFVLVGQLFWFFQSQSDIFIVGRVYTAHELGIYTTALFLTQMFVSKVVPPLNEVAFSAFSRIRHGDGRTVEAFLRSLQLIMFAGLPVFAGFALTAEPLVLVVLGEKWAGVIPFIVPLAIAMPLKTVLTLYRPVSEAMDRPDIASRNSLAGAIIMPVAFGISLAWGLMAIAYAWIAGYALLFVIASCWSLPVIGVTARQMLATLRPALMACLAMICALLALDPLLSQSPPLVRLPMLVVAGVAVYVGWLLMFARPVMLDIFQLVFNRGAGAGEPDPVEASAGA